MTSRRASVALLVLALLVVAGRLWTWQGITSIVRIEGGSMAETLPGERVLVVCPTCGRRWQSDSTQWQAVGSHACPQCGSPVSDADTKVVPGMRVVLDRAAYWFSAPRRDDVVAFASEAGELAVKRVVGLPGESLTIEDGDLWIDGQLVRKSYAQFRETAVLVANDHRQAKHQWRAIEDAAWQRTPNGWQAHGSTNARLEFQPMAVHPAARDKRSPVLDDDPYNPALARELQPVTDLFAECEWQSGEALLLYVHDGTDEYEFVLDLSEQNARLMVRGKQLAAAKLMAMLPTHVGWGTVDRQLWLVVGGQLALAHECNQRSSSRQPSLSPLAIVAKSNAQIAKLRVLRDVVYLSPRGDSAAWTLPKLGEDEYALLGDNPPLSIDCRQLGPARRAAIVGRVYPRENSDR
jgi:signal peptidase I